MLSDFAILFITIFFDLCVVEMVVLLRRIVLLGEAMNQRAFLSVIWSRYALSRSIITKHSSKTQVEL